MDTRYPTTEFEQLVLRAVRMLGNEAHSVTVFDKVNELAKKKVRPAKIHWTLDKLEDLGYVSSWMPEPVQEHDGGRRKNYHIEVYGERALTAPPVNDLAPSPMALRNRLLVAMFLLTVDNWNTFFYQVKWLYWPVRVAFVVAFAWVLTGIYKHKRSTRHGADSSSD